MQVPFGEWLPDQPEHLKPGANVATNVYHALNTYKRFPSLVNYSTNTTSTNARGAGSFRDNSNNIFNFVGTNSNLYQLASGTFTSRKSGLSGTDTDFVTFTQFGNHVIASNGVDAPQYYLMGTSTNFANLSSIVTAGTLPVFRVSGVIRDFFVTGNHTNNSNRIQWSGINDLTTWQPGTKQSDLQDLPGSGGQITHITSGEIGYVFRQNQIIRMDYVGGATVFRLSVISPNRGAVLGRTVCQDNRRVFFYADDGFYELNGDQVISIGDIEKKVNETVKSIDQRLVVTSIIVAKAMQNQSLTENYLTKNSEIFDLQPNIQGGDYFETRNIIDTRNIYSENQIVYNDPVNNYQEKVQKAIDDRIRAEQHLRRIRGY